MVNPGVALLMGAEERNRRGGMDRGVRKIWDNRATFMFVRFIRGKTRFVIVARIRSISWRENVILVDAVRYASTDKSRMRDERLIDET